MLNRLSITEAITGLQKGEFTSKDLVKSCLEQIQRVDKKINAFTWIDPNDAISQAEQADAQRAKGVKDKPLLGIPIAIKDLIAVKGHPLRCASKILDKFISPYDATVTERLRNAGAVLFGRTNMDEFAMGSSTENSAFGPTRNPWDLEKTPGGSSGGSAAAVSANECTGSLGSDTGGSIRQPASFCGCVGLKPTYGRVSRYGLVAYASSLDQIGPITKTVADSALLLKIIAGPDKRDSTCFSQPAEDYPAKLNQPIKALKVGVPKEYMIGGLDPDVKESVQNAIKVLEGLGIEFEEISLPHTEYAIATYYIIATAEASANLARFDGVRYGLRVPGNDPIEMYCNTRGAGFGEEVKRRIILGTYVLSSGYYDAYYLHAQKVRTLIRKDFADAFEKVDLILTPTCPAPAFKLGEKIADPLQMYLTDIFTISCNLAGICGISVPCGFTKTTPELPIGLQLLGKPMGEDKVLATAYAFEQSTNFHKKQPPLNHEQ
ncbi:MAG: Asp-tRNA(Asn)/Glu-tRNA(Gln) amidotransferase subunit GatA [Verrucomicrobiae bacterium]|nr:Asp-tRNA(Asn)/Glu-tRNA(Gln) amidotransferase subunit GatA [Verrucomicrobiae bacterium]